MTEPDFPGFFRTMALLRVRLKDPEPLDEVERDCLVEILNSFEEMMVSTRTLMERTDRLQRALQDLQSPPPAP